MRAEDGGWPRKMSTENRREQRHTVRAAHGCSGLIAVNTGICKDAAGVADSLKATRGFRDSSTCL